ncbi:ABC transporter ATP-binding protein [Alteribacter aurantiacus]|uniref:ABC transporter ATP-binding protein n=1 Tax=Alteribacter aurantiacus TaxID=254410 RepID=UPI0004112848|nr:ABC transporter ATP-binding protein [Alteribacter aurantiacus]
MNAVEMKHVLKQYFDGTQMNILFNDLNLTVKEGELVVIQGKPGSGKSTLLNMIAAMTPPNKGSVKVFGRNLLSVTRRLEWRSDTIGYISNNCSLMPYLTVKQNLLLGFQTGTADDSKAEQQAMTLLSELGMDHKRFDEAIEGLEQKDQILATIGRIFMAEPKLVLADEPTKSLDGKEGADVLGKLLFFTRKKGTTVIIVSNDENLAEMADRTLKMENGRLLSVKSEEKLNRKKVWSY